MKNILLILCPPVWHKLPPLGLAYISEYFVSLGISVDVVDLNVEDVEISDIIDRYEWVGLSVFKTNQYSTLSLTKRIKKKAPKTKVMLGGPQCFNWQFETPPVDIKYADKVVVGDALPQLDERPFPRFCGFKLNMYERKRALPIISSRGCIRRCLFCSECLLSNGYSKRSPENILKEIRYHKRINDTKWFTFHDSLINGDLMHLEKICDLLAEEKIHWDAQAIIRDDMSLRLLEKMKLSGCFNLFIGLESGSPKTLRAMRKGFTVKDAENFFRKCTSVGLHFEISLIAGYPGEGREEFNETLDFIKRNVRYIPKIAQVNPFIKYPGTRLKQTSINTGLKRVGEFIKVAEELGIKYTTEFVNNLVYPVRKPRPLPRYKFF